MLYLILIFLPALVIDAFAFSYFLFKPYSKKSIIKSLVTRMILFVVSLLNSIFATYGCLSFVAKYTNFSSTYSISYSSLTSFHSAYSIAIFMIALSICSTIIYAFMRYQKYNKRPLFQIVQ